MEGQPAEFESIGNRLGLRIVDEQSGMSRIIPSGVRVRGPLAFLAEMVGEHRRKGVAIFLAQSGTGTATLEAVQRARGLGWRAVSLTAERHSPLGAATGEMVVIPVAREPVGPKTKGYTASVLTLLLLAHALAGANRRSSPISRKTWRS